MKFVKLSVLALSLGLFVTSCGGENAETPKNDTTMAPAPAAEPTPAAEPAATDTTTAGPAKDTAMAPASH